MSDTTSAAAAAAAASATTLPKVVVASPPHQSSTANTSDEPQFTTGFHESQVDQSDVLLTGYVNKNFSAFSFQNPQSSIFRVKASVTQKIENNGTTQVHNNGLLELNYKKDDLKFTKTIDVNRNLSMRVEKTLKKSALQGHTIFGKFHSGTAASNEYQITPYCGFYKNLDRYAYKAKFNLESFVAQAKIKAMYVAKDEDVYGAGFSGGFDFKQNLTHNFKSLLYYKNPSTSMSFRHETKRAWRLDESTIDHNQTGEYSSSFVYSLYQKLHKHLGVAVELSNDSIEKKFGMVFGAKYTKFNGVVCRAKVDEKFLVNASFAIQLNDQVNFTLSNVIDLSIRNKKDSSATLNQAFPIGFALDITQ